MAVVIKAPHQPVIARPRDARRVQPARHALEKRARLARQEPVNPRRGIGDRPVARVFGIEDTQRILAQPRDAVLAQFAPVRLEMRDQRGAPRIARLGIAERIQLERHPVRYAEFADQLVREHQQFDIGHRLRRADDFGIDLVELAVTPLLRALIAKDGTVGDQFQRRILLPPLGQKRPRDARREFGPQRDRITPAILERIHLL